MSFWSGRSVFLTGHTGFKGSWLSLWLQMKGANLSGFALKPPTHPSLFEVADVSYGMRSTIGDIRDARTIASSLRDASPEVVIHMAAQPLVRASYRNPIETYETNVMGTVHLLEAVRQTPSVKAVLIVTSDKCYENREWQWGYREIDPMGGFDPYSSSKGCAELVTAAYKRSFFPSENFADHRVAIASARAGNVIGGGDWAEDRLIPDFIRAIFDGKPLIVRNPVATRPWQHVLEPLQGYLDLCERLLEKGAEFAEAWNFGPSDEDARPVSWIADRLVAKWGEGAGWIQDQSYHPHEAKWLKLDCSKAREALRWHPRMNLSLALDLLVEWFKEFEAGQNMRNITLSQISRYEKLGTLGSKAIGSAQ